jgi:hypothetical protein
MIKINTKTAPELLKKTLMAGLCPMLVGSPGIAKSSIIKEIANDFNLKVIDLRLSQCDPADLLGFPTIKGDKAGYVPMNTFPIEGDPIPEGYEGWLILLDEFNSAPLSVQAAAYKLVLDKQVGEYNLHKNVAIIAAGNLQSDKAITNRISTAMQSRMIHFELEINFKHWIDWGSTNGIDYRILAYINFKPDALFMFDPNHQDCTFPCPRTWEFTSKIIKQEPEIVVDLLPILAGCVGEATAREFYAFTSVFSELPTIQDIITNPFSLTVPDEPSTLYAISSLIGHHLSKDNITSIIEYVLRMPIEFQTITLRGAIRKEVSLINTPAVVKWGSANSELLV